MLGKGTLAAVFAMIIFMANMQFCFAETAAIPGYCGSGVTTYADLSSAVIQPSKYDDVLCVAVCTKQVFRSGRTEDCGVWYFSYSMQTGHSTVKTNRSKDYVIYNNFRKPEVEKHRFWQKLWNAAKANGEQ